MATTLIGQEVQQLKQTFAVTERYGVYITKIGLFFKSVSTTFPITLHLRFVGDSKGSIASVLKTASNMTSAEHATATTETEFVFDKPVALLPGNYAFSLESADLNEYVVWHSQLGDFKLGTTQERVIKDISPGSMFPPSVGGAQVINRDADLKFTIYRANFAASSATAVFKDANPPVKLLGNNPLYAKNAVGAADSCYVVHADHGFQVNDKVNIQGLTGGTRYNGVLGSNINGQRTITGVDGTGYKFALSVSGATEGLDSDVSFGGNGITATQHYRYDIAQLQMAERKPGNTEITYAGVLTGSKSFAGTETAYGTSAVKFQNQKNYILNQPHVVATDSNEATHLSNAESTTVTATFTGPSDDTFTSPFIDLQRSHLLTIGNRIDRNDPTATTNYNVPLTYVAETDPANGSALAKHITKPVTLAVPATGLKVLFAGHRPSTAEFDLYYRTCSSGTDSDILEKSFVLQAVDAAMPADKGDRSFHEYRYTVGGSFAATLPEFDKYQIKIVMNSQTSSSIPRIRDLRTIALN
tara:strand:- start:247 stop:1830 length:1584 start_codon:yes stop_codon:yes gene_type:complete